MVERSVCTYAMIPVRALPAESAEMVTQILFGETYEIDTFQSIASEFHLMLWELYKYKIGRASCRERV